MQKLEHLPEIDGLRAIAILTVVLFHAGVPWVSGGYVGVDVFFVISGFLITWLLVEEVLRTGTVDIVNFYARRVRRLLPALGVVLATTLAAGQMLLAPSGEQQELAAEALAAAGFVSNIFFWRTQTGYFAGPAEQLPLLHLWTLAVEEQFYIFWPLGIVAIALLARRYSVRLAPLLVIALVVGGMASAMLSWWVTPIRPTMAFYLTPFRAWEFGLGALLGIHHCISKVSPKPLLGSALIAIGLCAIAYASAQFGPDTSFPGIAAAVPALGAAGTIAGVMLAPTSRMSGALRSLPMVVFGKLSYSWYLWHWPLLALARVQALGERSVWRDLTLVLVALGLSALTYRFVEEPVRRDKPWPFSSPRRAVVAGLLILGSLGLSSVGVWRVADHLANANPLFAALKKSQNRAAIRPWPCSFFEHPFKGLAAVDRCIIGEQNAPLVVVWGDSHANALAPALLEQVRLRQIRLLVLTMGDCKPYIYAASDGVLQKNRIFEQDCIDFNGQLRAALKDLNGLNGAVAILAARWSVSGTWGERTEGWENALEKTVGEVRASGFNVILAADVPDFHRSVPQCLARSSPEICGRFRADVEKERAASLPKLDGISDKWKGVVTFDPLDTLCNRDRCEVYRDGQVLYFDSHHLSEQGAFSLSTALAEKLALVLEPHLDGNGPAVLN